MRRRTENMFRFLVATFIWLLTAFPCMYLGQFYSDPRVSSTALAGARGSGPIYHEIASQYLLAVVLCTVGVSIAGNTILWLVPSRWEFSKTGFLVGVGAVLGGVLGYLLWCFEEPRFQSIATLFFGAASSRFRGVNSYPLSPVNFVYSGLWAGAIAGELRADAKITFL